LQSFLEAPEPSRAALAIAILNTQYFKITIWSIALHFGIAIALAGFNPYCYTESAIFGKGDRASLILTPCDRAVGGN